MEKSRKPFHDQQDENGENCEDGDDQEEQQDPEGGVHAEPHTHYHGPQYIRQLCKARPGGHFLSKQQHHFLLVSMRKEHKNKKPILTVLVAWNIFFFMVLGSNSRRRTCRQAKSLALVAWSLKSVFFPNFFFKEKTGHFSWPLPISSWLATALQHCLCLRTVPQVRRPGTSVAVGAGTRHWKEATARGPHVPAASVPFG